MKHKTVLLASFGLLMGSISMSCNSPAKKVENAEDKVLEANKDLNQANQEYVTDIENYRKETAEKVAANEKTIADFNLRIASEKKVAKMDYQKQVAVLEKQNSDLKMRLENYKEEGKEKWEIFKTKFTHDMEVMGDALKNLTVKKGK